MTLSLERIIDTLPVGFAELEADAKADGHDDDKAKATLDICKEAMLASADNGAARWRKQPGHNIAKGKDQPGQTEVVGNFSQMPAIERGNHDRDDPDHRDHARFDEVELAPILVVDGETVQDDRTTGLVFDIPRLIAEISAVVPMLPGDLIFTGTPAGVGITRKPPRFLQAGQVLETWIEDGIREEELAFAKIDDKFEKKLIHGVRGVGYLLSDKILRPPEAPDDLAN